MNLTKHLDDIERRLDEREEQAVLDRWEAFADGVNTDGPFVPVCRVPRASDFEWSKVNINDAVQDEELMLLHQFTSVSEFLEKGRCDIFRVRSNYGVGILATMLGAEVYMMPYEMNTLPNVRHISEDAVQRLIQSDLPPFTNGFGARVLSVGEKLMEIKQRYPKIGKFIKIDHPDCQGPFDICELLYGSDIFLVLYDKPDMIHALMRKITDFYKAFLDKWFSIVPNTDDYHVWATGLHRGNICVRDDSAMNLSPEFYAEFIYPYDYEVLKYFGGGAVHFCGRGDHYIEKMSEMDCLNLVQMSQPEYNDMSVIFDNTVGKGINLQVPRGDYWDSIDQKKYQLTRLYLH